MLGGLLVAGGFLLLGVTGHQITDTNIASAPAASEVLSNPQAGISARAIYQRDAPGVVYVQATLADRVRSPFEAFGARHSHISTGSGFLVDRRGDILTAYHVIDGADEDRGVSILLEGGVERSARVLASEPDQDFAVLRVNMRGVPPTRVLPLGDSTSVRVGDPTLALGNPFGLDRTLTSGIVSALQHRIQAVGGATIDNVIQTQQPLSPGSSGGPLLNAAGRVIGIQSQVMTQSGQMLSFATPIDTAQPVLQRLQRVRR